MKEVALRVFDLLVAPLLVVSAFVMKAVRRAGVGRMPVSLRILRRVGVFPIRDYYYEPLFNPRHLTRSLAAERCLPGIDWNAEGQLALLRQFHWQDELRSFPRTAPSDDHSSGYHYANGVFESGDSEFLYSLIRLKRPRRIIEVGCGFSTLVTTAAVAKNAQETPGYRCEIVCVEPYRNPWLERLPVTVIRSVVERVDRCLFDTLEEDDILLIDSSHIVRPQGDVLAELLEILPGLRPGVIVHLHDIFSPRDYPEAWICRHVLFFNEQYLLEAFLSFNRDFKIVGALNYLRHRYPEALAEALPVIGQEMSIREPGSFWMIRQSPPGVDPLRGDHDSGSQVRDQR